MRNALRSPLRLDHAFLAALLLIVGCQEQPDPLDPAFGKVKVSRTLTVSGGGSGNGRVLAPDYGEAGALDCQTTAGTYDPYSCTKLYGWKTAVTLSAVPSGNSSFTGWSGACTGTAPTCKVTMTQSRSVRANFAGPGVPYYVLNVAGSGTGGGTVTSQSQLTPAISCTITAGTATSGSCSGSYPSQTSVILTASVASGHLFEGWGGACSGTGPCTLTVAADAAVTATFTAPAGIEATVGRWESSKSTPVIGVHLSLLPWGNALLWGHGGEPQLWDRVGGGFTEVANRTCVDPATCELFCAGHTFLADGRLLVAGGHVEALGDGNGLAQASIFDSTGWQATGSMRYGRWYPTLVTLENGNVVAVSGTVAPGTTATIPERWNGSAWTELTGANLSLPLYPRMFVEPRNGYVFLAGDGPSRFLNPNGTGAWLNGPVRVVYDRNYAPAVMLDSKVLFAGGGGSSTSCTSPPDRRAEIIDLAAASPTWTATGSMAFGRRHNNLTILPDGRVLVTGGSSQCGFTNEAGAVFAAEVWDPVTGLWTTLANATVARLYHSSTLLLPDGRVLSTGGGDGGGVTQRFSYEIFSPPYLFKGSRPTYTIGSTTMPYAQPFPVATPNAAEIRKVTLIRLASSTHASDMGQRLNTLAFQPAADGQSLTLTAPPSGRVAPPGPYLLFLVNDRGVPSVARTVLLGP